MGSIVIKFLKRYIQMRKSHINLLFLDVRLIYHNEFHLYQHQMAVGMKWN